MSFVSRRAFLGSSALAVGAVASPSWAPLAAAAPAAAAGPKLGLASYTMRKFTLDQTLDLCKELGITYINFKDVHLPMTDSPDAVEATLQKVAAAGLTVMGGGTITLKNDEAQVRKAFDYARRAKFPLIVTAPEPAAFDIIEKLIKETGIKVAVHNHGPEDKFFPAPQDAYKLLKGRDARFGLCMDIGHAIRAKVDIVQTVDEVKDRLLDVHAKDLKDKNDKASQTEVGKGVLDIPGFFRALKKVGYGGHVGLEYEINAESPQVGIRESFAYMRGVLAAI
jgi:sugar phosphate isomerase/epimerase